MYNSSRPSGLRTWIEINKNALIHNVHTFAALGGNKSKLMAVVKSNAYGCGLKETAKIFDKAGAHWLAVDSIVEALALRSNGIIKPILVLGPTLPERLAEAKKKNISVSVSTFHNLKAIIALKTEGVLRIHIKVDTGMHRQGFYYADLTRVLTELKKIKRKVVVEGLYTHFASADPEHEKETKKQWNTFKRATRFMKNAGFQPILHAAATGGSLCFSEMRADMIRVGIGLYGFYPSPGAKKKCSRNIRLEPAMSWKTLITEIKTVPKREAIGYGFTESLQKEATIAILPVGYWHGLPRALSSVGHVLVRGKRAKVIGRVCMDMAMIDISNIPEVKIGDTVTLIGKDKKETISPEETANLCRTVNYEIITRLNPLIKRLYI